MTLWETHWLWMSSQSSSTPTPACSGSVMTPFASMGSIPRIGNWNFRLGFVRERQGKYPEAAEAYAMAVRHAEKHTAYWIYRLAYVLEKAGETRAACLAFLHLQPDPDLPPGLIGDLDHPVLDCLRPQAMAIHKVASSQQ